jgi:hypothetical protein
MALGLGGLLLSLAGSAAPAAVAGAVQVDAGAEYDSNASRVDGVGTLPVRGGPLLRVLLHGQIGYQRARQRVVGQLQLGGKLFFLPSLQDQNVGVLQASYDHSATLGGQQRVRLGGFVEFFEAFQAPAATLEQRDFRTLGTGMRLAGTRPLGGLHRLDGGLDLAFQYFAFKPDSGFTFIAPSLAGRISTLLHAGDPELGHDIDLLAHGRVDYRGYLFGRTDVFVQLGTQMTWQGPVLAAVGYTVQLSLSNLADQSYQRHLLLGKLALRLPGELYLTAKAQINLLDAAPGLFVPIGNIDEDNRSLALLDLERAIGRGISISVRYTGYFSLPRDDGGQYQRHTAYLGLTYQHRMRRR